MLRVLKRSYLVISLFFILILLQSSRWLTFTFDNLSFDEIIFHLKVPISGSNTDLINSYVLGPLLRTGIVLLVVFILMYIIDRFFVVSTKMFNLTLFLTTTGLILTIYFVVNELKIDQFISNSVKQSTFFEDNYVQYDEGILSFQNEDRNLIYIFVESFENTFSSVSQGGALEEDLLSPLSDKIKKNTQFSNSSLYGGPAPAVGTTWTVAAMVSQTSGVPLKIPIEGNSYGSHVAFMPGLVSIGEILEDRGYNQTLLIGSDANFGGRRNYFTQHGNYQIKDYFYALDNKWIEQGYLQWWGYEDEKLFEFAKSELLELSSSDKPFNLTMLTADTHHVDGYATEGMEENFESQYKNVIFNTSKQLDSFLSWIQAQPFYENTTIVISGDHHTMDAGFINTYVDPDYKRTTFNLIINSVEDTTNLSNRDFASFDFFPTTLASMGIRINGERLGIGTNLFSSKKTLFEEFGVNQVNSELEKKSIFYEEAILYGR